MAKADRTPEGFGSTDRQAAQEDQAAPEENGLIKI